jgi:hypothetical protein
MSLVNNLLTGDLLVKLVQKENFIGWVYSIDYDYAYIMTNDLWKANALAVPHNCFLVAATFDPEKFSTVPIEEQEVILLRVVGSSKLPQDDDLIRTKIDYFQQQQSAFHNINSSDMDDITLSQLQFGGLQCKVLGTFYKRDGELYLGSDLESFATAARLNVYRPRREALEIIVNYVDPLRKKKVAEEAKDLGIEREIKPFKIGTVRYTSTDRLHRKDEEEKVPVYIQPSDFLARRTAVLGMTRTGKSNMIKQTVSVVKRVSDESGINIGQIIYDINGEYANANQQDKGSIADVYKDDVIRYRMIQTPGFKELRNNFYTQLSEGFSIIQQTIRENISNPSGDIQTFLNTSFDEPDKAEKSSHNRWQVKVAIYRTMLNKAGFEGGENFKVKIPVNQEVINAVNQVAEEDDVELQDPRSGISLKEAELWFTYARKANKRSKLLSSSKKPWLDDEAVAMLNMLVNKNDNDSYINGYKVLVNAKKYHSPHRNSEVSEEIYEYLKQGKIVILDLSVGNPTLREAISKQIAQYIFEQSMNIFINGGTPPNIVAYIEEAHNLIGKDMDLTETWPRIAKEGAKYKIALVYATQEVSSVHPNILANTENWFVSHLNNQKEVKELSKFYDFEDFSRSLIRAQDVGFVRMKTLSSPYVVPVQIDKFDPELEKAKLNKLS